MPAAISPHHDDDHGGLARSDPHRPGRRPWRRSAALSRHCGRRGTASVAVPHSLRNSGDVSLSASFPARAHWLESWRRYRSVKGAGKRTAIRITTVLFAFAPLNPSVARALARRSRIPIQVHGITQQEELAPIITDLHKEPAAFPVGWQMEAKVLIGGSDLLRRQLRRRFAIRKQIRRRALASDDMDFDDNVVAGRSPK